MGALAHDFANIVGVKDATAKVGPGVGTARHLRRRFHSSCRARIPPLLGFNAHGGVGCISVTSNVAPRLCAEFQAASVNGGDRGPRHRAGRTG